MGRCLMCSESGVRGKFGFNYSMQGNDVISWSITVTICEPCANKIIQELTQTSNVAASLQGSKYLSMVQVLRDQNRRLENDVSTYNGVMDRLLHGHQTPVKDCKYCETLSELNNTTKDD